VCRSLADPLKLAERIVSKRKEASQLATVYVFRGAPQSCPSAGKQMGFKPAGWREAADAYGEEGSRRSVADVTDAKSLGEVRTFKKAAKG
jgi:hypothetical protein